MNININSVCLVEKENHRSQPPKFKLRFFSIYAGC